jgi:hypothetical protein
MKSVTFSYFSRFDLLEQLYFYISHIFRSTYSKSHFISAKKKRLAGKCTDPGFLRPRPTVIPGPMVHFEQEVPYQLF